MTPLRRWMSGQAMTEWSVVVGTVAIVALVVFAVVGTVLQHQSSSIASELAGGDAPSGLITDGGEPISVLELVGMTELRRIFGALPGAGESNPGGGGQPGHGGFTPVPSPGGGGSGNPSTCGAPDQGVGNPIHVVTGNKYQYEIDLARRPGPLGLEFVRHYNSAHAAGWGLGVGWRHGFQVQLRQEGSKFWLWRPDGRQLRFERDGEPGDGAVHYRAQRSGDGTLRILPGRSYAWHQPTGRTFIFDADRRLIRIEKGKHRLQLYYDSENRLESVMDPKRRTLRLTYYANGRLATIAGLDGRIVAYRYDASGNLTHVLHPNNTFRRYYYEDPRHRHHLTGISSGRVTSRDGELVTEDEKPWSRYAYDEQGRAVLSVRADGVGKVVLEYRNNEVAVTDAAGRTSVYSTETRAGVPLVTAISGPGCSECGAGDVAYRYDDRFQLTSATDRGGITERYTYDSQGRLHQRHRVLPGAAELWLETNHYAADGHRLPTKIEGPSANPDGMHVTELDYSAGGRLETLTETGYTPTPDGDYEPLRREVRYDYDRFGRIVAIDGPREDVDDTLRFTYDPNDRVVSALLAQEPLLTVLERDSGDRVLRLQIGAHPPATLHYNSSGAIEEVRQRLEDSTERTVAYRYGTRGELSAITSKGGVKVDFGYDDAGRFVSLMDRAGGLEQRRTYARDGLLERSERRAVNAESSEESSRHVDYQYDVHRRLTEVRSGDGTPLARYRYGADDARRPNQYVDAMGHRTRLVYDAYGALMAVTAADDGHAKLREDVPGRTEVTDASGHTTRILRDDFGRVVSVQSADAGATWYRYDAAGNRVLASDGRGLSVRMSYDAANRLVRRENADGTTGFEHKNTRLTEVHAPAIREHLEHDALGRIVKHRREIDGHVFVYGYEYDGAGDRPAVKRLPDGQRLLYRYDEDGVLREIVRDDLIGETLIAGEIDYVPRAGTVGHLHGNGVRSRMVLSARDSAVVHKTESGLFESAYVHDAGGRLRRVRTESASAGGTDETYEYDSVGRMVKARTRTGQYAYEYDLAGNRVGRRVDGQTARYEYNAGSNRLLAVHAQKVESYSYDAAGNPVQIGERRYVYDADGRPIEVYRGETLRAEYAYGVSGERIKKVVHDEASGETLTAYYVYEGGRLVAEADAEGKIRSQYVYVDDKPIAAFRGKNLYAIHTDHRGAPMAVTDRDRRVVWRAEYSPFGRAGVYRDPDGDGESFELALRLPGQLEDEETGTHYNYFRDYDPRTGRYLQSDPLGIHGGLNTYVYAENDPLSRVDPLGLNSFIVISPPPTIIFTRPPLTPLRFRMPRMRPGETREAYFDRAIRTLERAQRIKERQWKNEIGKAEKLGRQVEPDWWVARLLGKLAETIDLFSSFVPPLITDDYRCRPEAIVSVPLTEEEFIECMFAGNCT